MACRTIGCALLIAMTVWLTGCGGEKDEASTATTSGEPLICHVGGTMRPVMAELAELYKARTGQAVEINSAGSGELLAHIEMQKSGDVYVCHDPFLQVLMAKGLGVDGWSVAELTPVIVVQKGNPKNIRGLADLASDDVELLLTDYKRSTLGRMLTTIFAKVDIDLAELHERKQIETNKSGSYVANKVKMRNADAAIVWNVVGQLRADSLDIVPIPAEHLPIPGVDAVTTATHREYTLTPVGVTVATLKCSQEQAAAKGFAEFLASDEAREVFTRHGYTMAPVRREYADGRRVGPTLRLFSGAGLRPAVERLIERFTEDTGITIEPDYGGSGLILSRVQQETDVDLFLPGDKWYVDQLAQKADMVESRATVAWFVPVMIVAKGNPKGITDLTDLVRPDVRIGLGNPKACQVGRITRKILSGAGVDVESRPDAAQLSLTVNELGVWVKMGQIDAAIVWDAIATNIADSVDVVAIDPRQNKVSEVVMAVLRTSTDIDAARQFMRFVAGEQGRAILNDVGYQTEAPATSQE